MSALSLAAMVAAGLFVGANIGANDAANCIGPSYGAGLVRYGTGIALVALCVVAGAVLQGGSVLHTVGKGIVTAPMSTAGVMVALSCAGLFVTLATLYKVPVSTSQAVVGAVGGVGLAAGLPVDASKLLDIVGSWVICPVLTMAMTYALYRLVLVILAAVREHWLALRVLRVLVLLSAGYVAYGLGANHLGLTIGPIVALEGQPLDPWLLTGAGALSIAAGAVVFGRGVVETVGHSIVPLDLPGAFAVQLSSGFGVHLFSMLGLPVSSSQAIVGALVGVGIYHGVKAISRRKLAEVAVGWVAAPTLSGVVALVVYRLVVLAG